MEWVAILVALLIVGFGWFLWSSSPRRALRQRQKRLSARQARRAAMHAQDDAEEMDFAHKARANYARGKTSTWIYGAGAHLGATGGAGGDGGDAGDGGGDGGGGD